MTFAGAFLWGTFAGDCCGRVLQEVFAVDLMETFEREFCKRVLREVFSE